MAATSHKPWPMKWVALTTLVFIVLYTWLTLHYRKAEKPFEPYEDMKNQANVIRLLAHNYQRVIVAAEPVSGPIPLIVANPVKADARSGGYPKALSDALAEPSPLPLRCESVLAPSEAQPGQAIPLVFGCVLANRGHAVEGLEIYHQASQVYLVPLIKPDSAAPDASQKPLLARAGIPADFLKPGAYQVRLLGAENALEWALQVH